MVQRQPSQLLCKASSAAASTHNESMLMTCAITSGSTNVHDMAARILHAASKHAQSHALLRTEPAIAASTSVPQHLAPTEVALRS